jgi:hypothetical protein
MTKQAYNEEALGRSVVFKWHKYFERGRDRLEYGEHTGLPRRIRTELKLQEVATMERASRSSSKDWS